MALDRALPRLHRRHRAACHARPQGAAAISADASPKTAASTGRQSAAQIHNLVRAVAPPYPGAFFDLPDGRRLRLLRTLLAATPPRFAAPTLYRDGDAVFADCADGHTLRVLAWDGDWDGATLPLR